MRYYSIAIDKPDGTPYQFKSLGSLALTSLLPTSPQNPRQGVANRAALQVEFDIPVYVATTPDSNAWLRVWGLGVQDIGSAANLNGCTVSISAGMSKGLPLANPAQAGLVMKGTVLQAFGNWSGPDQTVDMNFVAGGDVVGSSSDPQNFPFVWQPHTPLSTAIAQTLKIAMPGYAQSINISPKLVIGYTMSGHYQSLDQFSQFIGELCQSLVGGKYQGVVIATNGVTVTATDGTVAAPTTKAIAYTDLIGQPTWIGPATISVKTVMRADLHARDSVTLPPSLVTTTAQAMSAFQDKTSFSGNYDIQQVHHYGNFRQASAESWATVFQMTPTLQAKT